MKFNHKNRKRKNNTTGYTGVNQVANGRWVAKLHIGERWITAGTFDTIEEAAAGYQRILEQHKQECQKDNELCRTTQA